MAAITDQRRECVGVVGLGAMGGAIATNLLDAGFQVFGFDVDADRSAALTRAGGTAAGDAASVAAYANVVITSLPSERALEAALFDPAGIATVSRDGLVVVEASTLSLRAKQTARRRLAEDGTILLDCPLSGTGDQARSRDLVVMASGDSEAIAGCSAIFSAFARVTHNLGCFGSGTKLKLVANLLVGIHNVAAAEAVTLAERSGLDVAQALEVLHDGAGASKMLEVRGPKMLTHDYGSGVRMSVFLKDVSLIAAFAAEEGVVTPLFDRCADIYREAIASGLIDEDTSAVVDLVRAARPHTGSH